MNELIINYWAILVATIAAMVIGMIWYSVLNKSWINAVGITPEQVEEGKQKGFKGMQGQLIVSFVCWLVVAYVFTHVLNAGAVFWHEGFIDVTAGLSTAFWVWLGFMAPATLINQTWEGKPWKLFWINAGHYLLVLLAMGVILGAWI